jgi:ATP-dependent DNA helicase RecG
MNEMIELIHQGEHGSLVHFDRSPVAGTTPDDLDEGRLDLYWRNCYQLDYSTLDQAERIQLLLNADLLTQHEEATVCTVGGLLLFGRTPQRRLPQSAIRFAVFDGVELTDTLLDKKDINGTLPELIDNTAGLVRLFIPRPSSINGMKRDEKELLPPAILREVLVNAVCHRDYSLVTRQTQVFLYRDRLEVRSPGRLPNSLTIAKIRSGNSSPRNLLLLKYLDNLRYIDGLGRGIPLMLRALGERVTFAEQGELFLVSMALR